MNENKKQERRIAKVDLQQAGISYVSLNNDLHWKIGTSINFFPTTGRWRDEVKDETGQGTRSLIRYIKGEKKITESSVIDKKQLSVQQISKIFLKNEGKSLMEKCELLHKEIYG